jgi:hypothetical protein
MNETANGNAEFTVVELDDETGTDAPFLWGVVKVEDGSVVDRFDTPNAAREAASGCTNPAEPGAGLAALPMQRRAGSRPLGDGRR